MLNLSWTLIFNMSTQKDVVKDVKAESALEYAAAIKPKIKIIIKGKPKVSLNITAGNRSSGLEKIIPCLPAKVYSNAPRHKNIKFTKIKLMLK